jgi:hypothetical protein
MALKQRFSTFVKNIKPTESHLSEARRQTDYMVEQLHDMVAADKTFELLKVLRAGSNAKHTSLLRNDENVFDVDLGAYYSGAGATKAQLGTLLEFTHAKLWDIYKNVKEKKDFTILKSAVRVKFRSGIELWVDVAPIIKDDSLGITNGGWIPRDDDEWRLTSVTAHNEFISSRNKSAKTRPGPVTMNGLVRMMKWWNNRLDATLQQPAIFTESVVAAAIAEIGGVTDEWQTSLRAIFSFLRKHQFEQAIIFGDYYDAAKVSIPKDTVVVLDAVNASNNVARLWTKSTREAYLEAVEDAFTSTVEALSAEMDDDEESAVDAWCQIFGSAFRTLSESKDAA